MHLVDLVTDTPPVPPADPGPDGTGRDLHRPQDHGRAGTPPAPTRRQRLALPVGLGAATVCGCVAVAAFDPGDDGVPLCWSRAVFGVDCPFCGGLRATNALLRGQFGAALDHNVVLAVALPVAVLMWVWWMARQWRDTAEPARRVPPWITALAAVLLVAFGVVRNFAGPAWIRWLYSDTLGRRERPASVRGGRAAGAAPRGSARRDARRRARRSRSGPARRRPP